MELTLYAESVDDITPVAHNSLAVELSGVDISQLIEEIGVDELLEEVGTEAIEQYLKTVDEDENGEVAA